MSMFPKSQNYQQKRSSLYIFFLCKLQQPIYAKTLKINVAIRKKNRGHESDLYYVIILPQYSIISRQSNGKGLKSKCLVLNTRTQIAGVGFWLKSFTTLVCKPNPQSPSNPTGFSSSGFHLSLSFKFNFDPSHPTYLPNHGTAAGFEKLLGKKNPPCLITIIPLFNLHINFSSDKN